MTIYKYAIIELGVVKNVAVATEEVGTAEGWVKLPEDTPVNKGWLFNNGGFELPPQDVAVIKRHFIDQAHMLLLESDALIANDLWEGYTDAQRQAWISYRQLLRNVPTVVNSEGWDADNYELPTIPVSV
ncbi:phage tail assembly chaperone [bacterium]|nr:phage tail assembly chaperone [bacterium]